MCRQMVEEGRLTVTEIKVPKKGKLKQYAVATTADAEKMGGRNPSFPIKLFRRITSKFLY